MPIEQAFRRRVVGAMSGTSLDGIDVAVVDLQGSGSALGQSLVAFETIPYSATLRDRIIRASHPDTARLDELVDLGIRLAHAYADAIGAVMERVTGGRHTIDLVGAHGQTIWHMPSREHRGGPEAEGGSYQLLNLSVLAQRLGIPVVGDFRSADLAVGGEGAPLVPYYDYVTFQHGRHNRLLLNLGGIANITVLPAAGDRDAVHAFDTGPANMVIDQLAQRLFDQPFDPSGSLAAQGSSDAALLDTLLSHPYFDQAPPKSTGREQFGASYVDELLSAARARGLSSHDILATATRLTAVSIHDAVDRWADVRPNALHEVIVGGGGWHNLTLRADLQSLFPKARVISTAEFAIDPDAKEAICFAVLAHERLLGVPTNVPRVTGAKRPVVLGVLAHP